MKTQTTTTKDDYIKVLCVNCKNNEQCKHEKITITEYNSTKNIRCLGYEFINNEK